MSGRIKRTERHFGTGPIQGARAVKRGVGSIITERLYIDAPHDVKKQNKNLRTIAGLIRSATLEARWLALRSKVIVWLFLLPFSRERQGPFFKLHQVQRLEKLGFGRKSPRRAHLPS